MQKILDMPCVIFAGGKSSRMGKDKSLLPFENSSLVKFQYERLKEIFSEVCISTKIDKFDFKAHMIFDKSDIFAPTVAFKAIFEKFDNFFAISVDTPFVDEEVIKKLINVYKNNKTVDAVIAKTKFPHPLIGIYQKSILPTIERELEKENYKLVYILKNSNTIFVKFEEEEKFFNINYPDDYKNALLKSTKISNKSNLNFPFHS